MNETMTKFNHIWAQRLNCASEEIRKGVAEAMAQLEKDNYHGTYDLSDDVYHHMPAVSKGQLQDFSVLPARYYHKMFKEYDYEPTDPMKIGTIFHRALLDPHGLQKTYWSDGEHFRELQEEFKNPRATKVYKETVARKLKEGFTVIKEDDLNLAFEMVRSCMSIKKVHAMIDGGIKEHAQFAVCPSTGLLLKSKPDLLFQVDGIIVDLKTAISAQYDEFNKAVLTHWYHIQGVHYLRVANLIEAFKGYTHNYSGFGWIIAEKVKPYPVALRQLDLGAYEHGQRTYTRTLTAFANAVNSGQFSGYPEEWEVASLPAWAFGRD